MRRWTRLAAGLSLAICTPRAHAQTVTFTDATAEDDGAADALIAQKATASGLHLPPPILRLLRRRAVVVTTLRLDCPVVFRFANVSDEALYDLTTFTISLTHARPHGQTTDSEPAARQTGDTSLVVHRIPYLPARQGAVVYLPCTHPTDAPPRVLSLGHALSEVDFRRLLVVRRGWDTTSAGFGPGYIANTVHVSDAEPTAIMLAQRSSMIAADRAAFRARLAASWRGGRALYNATREDGRDALTPPPDATADGLLGIASARLDDPTPSPWSAAPFRAACVRASLRARLDEVRRTLPAGVQVDTVYDRTTLVDHVLETVRRNLIEGALLVIAVLLVFLGQLRAGLIVAAAIPLSMLFAFDLMVRVGIAGSLMSLGAIDFGLIVDSSVIMVENAVRHGIAKLSTAGLIRISARREGEALELLVEDDGAGFSREWQAGVGLSNVRARLTQAYGAQADMTVAEREPQGASVRLRLPYFASSDYGNDQNAHRGWAKQPRSMAQNHLHDETISGRNG